MRRVIKIMLLWPALALPLFASDFNFTSFDFPGCSLTRPFGVNVRGQIVGLCRDTAAHGFLLDLNHGSYTAIDVPGAIFTNATGINAQGDIVGRWTDTAGNNHGYLRTPDGQFTLFDPLAPCVVNKLQTVPHGINDVGDIVGRCFDDSGKELGFLRRRDETFTIIDYPGSVSTDAWMLTDAGRIVGDYSDSTGLVHGYLLTPDGQFTAFDFPGVPITSGRWIQSP